eukprot:TRINITY_DN28827_c1_g1_i1.p1 TRINITY_DN28827_c1_g1~~TRINITY_DN28827_c1_g1_i1.p1  ORF type:complete len:209 (-),score=52.84 TRINITY_DN28827_c1_g1_i1:7-633(-)
MMRTPLSAKEYSILVKRVYEENGALTLEVLADLLNQYQGKERELFDKACHKYEADADALIAGLRLDNEELQELELPSEDELANSVLRLEAEIRAQKLLTQHRRREVKDLKSLLQLGLERRRCHRCDLELHSLRKLLRGLTHVHGIAEQHSDAELLGLPEDLPKEAETMLKELTAAVEPVMHIDPQLAELANCLSRTRKKRQAKLQRTY